MHEQSRDSKHEFALFYGALQQTAVAANQLLTLTDADLMHRIVHVLRLRNGEQLMLFDGTMHVRLRIDSIDKKKIVGTVLMSEPTQPLQPTLTVWLPVLKREALEAAVDAVTQMGATTIALTYCAKSRQNLQEKDIQRLHKIAIAACEQAKQFAVPTIAAPAQLAERAEQLSTDQQLFFFDPTGMPAYAACQQLHNDTKPTIVAIGPEGDLTTQEKEMLRDAGAQFVALTPTILRAEQAVALAVGLVRCCVR
jgi:16S rRNA (uracil1498-N3)-methyltransferase